MRHPGQVLSRQQILNGVWGYTFDPRSNLVDVYIGYLRRKLTTTAARRSRPCAAWATGWRARGPREGRARDPHPACDRERDAGGRRAGRRPAHGLPDRSPPGRPVPARPTRSSAAADLQPIGRRDGSASLGTGRRRGDEEASRAGVRRRLVDAPTSRRAGGSRPAAGQRLATAGRPAREQPPAPPAVARTRLPGPGPRERVEIAGEEYVVAGGPPRPRPRFVAAVPAAEAEAGVRTLLDAMLIVCLVGLVPATVAAWLVDAAGPGARCRASPSARRASPPATSPCGWGRCGRTTRSPTSRSRSTPCSTGSRAAFAAQRRFVHDASHELRTPLTIARGHLETALVPAAPTRPSSTRPFESRSPSSTGWARLVESLLRLARTGADEPADARARRRRRARPRASSTARASSASGLERRRRAGRAWSRATPTRSSRCS